MTKLKLCSKIHLFIIISTLLIAIGMAVGTICHFVANGFFNYGGEFASYKCVTVNYYNSEYVSGEDLRGVCEESLKGFHACEVSYSENTGGGEIIYKYSYGIDSFELQKAVDALNVKLQSGGESFTNASLREGVVNEGGARALKLAAIAVASVAALEFIYFVIRYKLRGAFSALLGCVHNLGVFVALAAITRIPVGAEMITVGAVVVLATLIFNGIFFDRTRKNFKAEKYAKTDRLEVVDVSADQARMITLYSCCALAIGCVVLGALAAISSLYIGAFAPYVLGLFGAIALFYGSIFFTPAVHGGIDKACQSVLNVRKNKKSKKNSQPAKSEVTEGKEKA